MPPQLRAALLCILSCAFFAGAGAFAKAAQTLAPGPDLHPLQVTAGRFLFAFLALLPFLLWTGASVLRTEIPLRHLQRVVFGVAGVAFLFSAVREIPLGDATAIAWASPMFALVFAWLFLKEPVDRRRWLAAVIGFTGIVVMVRPTSAAFEPAALLALAAAVFVGAEVVTIRLLATRDGTLTVLILNNAMGAVIACLAASAVFVMPSAAQIACMVAVGVVMLTGQAIFFKALVVAEASFVAPFYYATLIWATLIGLLVFGEVPGWHLLVGASLVITGGVLVSWRSGRPASPRIGLRP